MFSPQIPRRIIHLRLSSVRFQPPRQGIWPMTPPRQAMRRRSGRVSCSTSLTPNDLPLHIHEAIVSLCK